MPSGLASDPGLVAERDSDLLPEIAGIIRSNGDGTRLLPDPREIDTSVVEYPGEDRAGVFQDRDQQMAGVNDPALVLG